MSDLDKMMAFGHWLTMRREQLTNELLQMSVSVKYPEAAIRVKAGHIESTTHILDAFKELYNGELNKFKVSKLGHPEESEEESDGHSESST